MENETHRPRNSVVKSIVVVAIVLLALLLFSWILSRGVENDLQSENPDRSSTPTNETALPGGQVSPTGTGGSTGAGTGTSNDTNIQTPSPAGGIDTNNSSTNQ